MTKVQNQLERWAPNLRVLALVLTDWMTVAAHWIDESLSMQSAESTRANSKTKEVEGDVEAGPNEGPRTLLPGIRERRRNREAWLFESRNRTAVEAETEKRPESAPPW